jgi:hypothetical protein
MCGKGTFFERPGELQQKRGDIRNRNLDRPILQFPGNTRPLRTQPGRQTTDQVIPPPDVRRHLMATAVRPFRLSSLLVTEMGGERTRSISQPLRQDAASPSLRARFGSNMRRTSEGQRGRHNRRQFCCTTHQHPPSPLVSTHAAMAPKFRNFIH